MHLVCMAVNVYTVFISSHFNNFGGEIRLSGLSCSTSLLGKLPVSPTVVSSFLHAWKTLLVKPTRIPGVRVLSSLLYLYLSHVVISSFRSIDTF